MAMVGHKTESIFRRYAIVDAAVLWQAAETIDEASGHTLGHTRRGLRPAGQEAQSVSA
jgi:hypothetical protein